MIPQGQRVWDVFESGQIIVDFNGSGICIISLDIGLVKGLIELGLIPVCLDLGRFQLRLQSGLIEFGIFPDRKFTPRQREVLQLVVEGKSAGEIADILCISSRTVEYHKHKMIARRSAMRRFFFGLAVLALAAPLLLIRLPLNLNRNCRSSR